MKKLLIATALLVATVTTPVTLADTPSQQLGTCLIDSLNGKERKELAKWIFISMAAHPEISPYANISNADINATDSYVGTLITRLLTEDCAAQLRSANNTDPRAIQQAFELVGQVAMQELMTHQRVGNALTGYAQYADMDKINVVLTGE
ncbi:hypothetical protein [Motiliproteus sediminis]|uniref:hypothetical protein n=1 Tax=Motiliproteus sediminis TaxID=1468178 RepID=UPI001AEFC220|nr:hypothetical protein [Motiliproteus sediminis]